MKARSELHPHVPLLLATRNKSPPFTHLRLVALRECHNEVVTVCLSSSFDDLFGCRLSVPELDVLLDGSGEQHCLLTDQPDLTPQPADDRRHIH